VTRAYNIVSADNFKGLGDRLTPAVIIPTHPPKKRSPAYDWSRGEFDFTRRLEEDYS
jgi:hypothetical protein